jgi:LDH2 family malate/lactate/ureidoglycolate dehydrogenase
LNTPPTDFIRVDHEDLARFVSTAALTVGLPEERADHLGRLLATNDLRGIVSHGTQQIATYARLMRDGVLNNKPDVHLVRETPVSVLMDGDGGLGYFPAYEGTIQVVEKAKTSGIAVMVSRNHGHFGAAGIYSRLGIGHDLLMFVTSGHQMRMKAGGPIYNAGGGSPMSFLTPTDTEDPMILDFGVMHDLYGSSQHRDQIAQIAPAVVFRSIGLGAICQSWGGLLSGLAIEDERSSREYEGANQGAFVIALRIDLFTDPDRLKREMDIYARKVRELAPLTGFSESMLPGAIEAKRERAYREAGVPVGKRHRERLEELGSELEIEVPW